ncbi:helix-turn-helix transcriptional regulator [Rhizobium sp. NRK18]|uniref:helix-turn-helix transcriptional regulator n=1 Tax=Rhizobium sp. NRK18 TaxID=2964667 RepID=UPI0039659F89
MDYASQQRLETVQFVWSYWLMLLFDILKDPIGFYTFDDVCRITGLSKKTIYRYMDKGHFPRPVSGRPRKTLWWIADVHEWIRRKLQEKVA